MFGGQLVFPARPGAFVGEMFKLDLSAWGNLLDRYHFRHGFWPLSLLALHVVHTLWFLQKIVLSVQSQPVAIYEAAIIKGNIVNPNWRNLSHYQPPVLEYNEFLYYSFSDQDSTDFQVLDWYFVQVGVGFGSPGRMAMETV
jgi:hypothetical protein